MRPHRVRLTHSLVDNYNLGERMTLHRPQRRSEYQISQFHADGTSFPPSPPLRLSFVEAELGKGLESREMAAGSIPS